MDVLVTKEQIKSIIKDYVLDVFGHVVTRVIFQDKVEHWSNDPDLKDYDPNITVIWVVGEKEEIYKFENRIYDKLESTFNLNINKLGSGWGLDFYIDRK
jgi:hypothetical protein